MGHEVPAEVTASSLGCANPVALAELRPGEDVLDLGSGGGLDVLLSARRVAPGGTAYGLDMTEEMLELARRHQAKAGVENVEFLRGTLEEIPLPDQSVDVVLSNCVINLSPDKPRALREAHRILRPGGRLAVADIVTTGELPPGLRRRQELWTACIAGAVEIDEYRRLLRSAGFLGVEIEVVRSLSIEDLGAPGRKLLTEEGIEPDSVDGLLASALIRARKPVDDDA